MTTSESVGRLSPEEVDLALRSATGAEWARMNSLARLTAVGLHDWAPEDLLSEALTLLLDGTRVWRCGVDLLVTLKTIMRSIAYDERKKVKNGPIDHRVLIDTSPAPDALEGHLPSITSIDTLGPEQIADARNQLKYLEELVADDEEASMVLMVWAEGLRGKEAADELNYDAKRYDAARQRLLTRIKPLANLRRA